MFNQSTVFEQPVNELIRLCLRIEHLSSLAQHGLRGHHLYDTYTTVFAIVTLLSLTDRPDLRGKFTKELMRQQAALQRFINEEHIDQSKLQQALSELEKVIALLQNHSGKFAMPLRDNEFLASVKQHFSMAGGVLSFDTPAFFHWLQYPLKERQIQLSNWISEYEELFYIATFLLRLIRQSGRPVLHTAQGGFFQTSLDANVPCQLIRVAVANTLLTYPEISVGHHGVSIRFYHPTVRERATPYGKDVAFRLSCCII